MLYVKYDPILVSKQFKLQHAKPGDVGYDLPVVMDERLKIEPFKDYYINWEERWFDVPPHGSAEVPCGMAVKIPDDAWGNIKGRSSTRWKRKLHVAEGVIDSDYVGPLYVLVDNPNNIPIRIAEFDRIAQLLILPKYVSHTMNGILPVEEVEQLPDTVRGQTGFGSSGGIKHQ